MTQVENRAAPLSVTAAGGGRHAAQRANGGLRGNMGTFGLVFTVLAFNAPLAVLAGTVPVVFLIGNRNGAPIAYLAVGVLVLVFAVGLNAMAKRMKAPGAFYCYITHGLGRPAGLGGGFLAIFCYVVLGSGTYAVFALAFNEFLSDVVHVGTGPWWLWALCAWALGTGLSLLNVEVSTKVLGVAMMLELCVVAIWNLRVFVHGGPQGHVANPFPSVFSGSPSLALVMVALSLIGFESVQVFREETRDAHRVVPRATYICVVLLASMYALCAFAYLVAEGPKHAVTAAADPTGSMLASIRVYVANWVGTTANVLLLSSSFAACLAIQNVAARYIYALGKDRVLPRSLGRVNAKHGSPVIAACASGALMLIAFMVPEIAGVDAVKAYTALFGIGGYSMVALWAATSLSVVVFFRRSRTDRPGIWRALLAPLLSFAGLAAILVTASMHISSLIGDGAAANIPLALAALVVVAGVVTALSWKRRDRSVYRGIGGQDL